jgi:hypothetical protein
LRRGLIVELRKSVFIAFCGTPYQLFRLQRFGRDGSPSGHRGTRQCQPKPARLPIEVPAFCQQHAERLLQFRPLIATLVIPGCERGERTRNP